MDLPLVTEQIMDMHSLANQIRGEDNEEKGK